MADPLSVTCPACESRPGWPCRTVAIVCYFHDRKPHAARVRAAERAEKEASRGK